MKLALLVLLLTVGSFAQRPNILFIGVDDLRPQIGSYGIDFMQTPNIDAFAKTGVQFQFSYVQQAVCSPSRTSLLTGRRPETTHIWNLWEYFRNQGCNVTTLPEFFKQQGYQVGGQGKIFHPGHASDFDDPPSWTVPYYHSPDLGNYSTRASSWATPDYPEDTFPDAQVAAHAIQQLKTFKANNKPFFCAVGFHKPHLPFVFPKKYLDLYPNQSIAADPYPPKNMPGIAWSNFGELRNYDDIKALNITGAIGKDVPDYKAEELRRAYYGATSFTDRNIGLVLDALKEEGLDDNTIVIMWGDHGWQLGEHGEWCKHTNFELAARAPMILRAPKYAHLAGTVVTESLVEHVDMYPTLVDLAGFTVDPNLQGFSLRPILENPGQDWGKVALSQYPRESTSGGHKDDGIPHAMGYSLRNKQWRYTEWVHYDPVNFVMNWTHSYGRELYNHTGDKGDNFSDWENVNIVDEPSVATIVAQLSEQLHTLFDSYKRVGKAQCKN